MDKLWDLVKELFKSVPPLLMVLGLLLIVLGLSKGIGYHAWLPIDGLPERIVCSVVGVAVFALGFMAQMRGLFRPRDPFDDERSVNALGIRITHPEKNAIVGVVDVHGSIAKPELIRDGYTLRICKGYVKGGFAPQGEITIDRQTHTWTARQFDPGGASKESRRIEVWLIGADGQALLECWSEAHELRSRNVRKLREMASALNRHVSVTWTLPIRRTTRDMHRCTFVDITRE